MKFVSLLQAARIAGELKFPADGALEVSDEDAARLIENGDAVDVTADFEPKGAAKGRAATKE